ncbi:MAG: DUF3048 domain-containing protein [Candidatus Paceibacteria bacterium]
MSSSDDNIFGLTKEQYLYVLSAIITLTAIALLAWFAWGFYSNPEVSFGEKAEQKNNSETKECEKRRRLDGYCIKGTEFEQNPKLAGMMIENHVESRPASGLSEARVVYEAPVEGNITRFLALYTKNQTVEKVGPIRSARPYFIDWVREYGDMMYAHVGGSPSALDYIKNIDINDLDQFSKGWYFWRSENRDQPHNVYTSSDLWQKALEEYSGSYEDKDYNSWAFANKEECRPKNTATSTEVNNCSGSINLNFSSPHHKVRWQYNSSTDKYERFQSGKIHRDKSGDAITADTVVIQHVDTEVIDQVGRLNMSTTGTGKAVFLMKGHKIEGEWKKDSRSSRTKFFNSEGDQIKLQPGKIWIEVVNQRTSVKLE